MNDKQILTECFKSFSNLGSLVITKAHTYLKNMQLQVAGLFNYVLPFLPPGLKGLTRFPACYELLDNFIEIWIIFGLEEK